MILLTTFHLSPVTAVFDVCVMSQASTLLARWTGGLLRPARQRVVAGGNVTGRSTSVFYYPSRGTVLEPLPAFAGPGDHGDRLGRGEPARSATSRPSAGPPRAADRPHHSGLLRTEGPYSGAPRRKPDP